MQRIAASYLSTVEAHRSPHRRERAENVRSASFSFFARDDVILHGSLRFATTPICYQAAAPVLTLQALMLPKSVLRMQIATAALLRATRDRLLLGGNAEDEWRQARVQLRRRSDKGAESGSSLEALCTLTVDAEEALCTLTVDAEESLTTGATVVRVMCSIADGAERMSGHASRRRQASSVGALPTLQEEAHEKFAEETT